MKKYLPWFVAMLAIAMRADSETLTPNPGPVVENKFLASGTNTIGLFEVRGHELTSRLTDIPSAACTTVSRPEVPPRSSGRGVILPAGTEISIRLLEKIDVSVAAAGRQFRATVEVPVTMGGDVLIPRGANALVDALKV